MTYKDFIAKWIGKGIDYDGAYKNQCMDVYRQYVKEVLLCPQSPPVAGAKDVWNTYLSEYFDRVPNSPEGVPQEGDVVIWGMQPYGHIAICDHASTSTLTCFEQNWVEGDGSGVTELRLHGNYNNVLGWLKFKKPQEGETMTEQEKIMLDFIRQNKITEGQLRQGYGYIADKIDEKVTALEKLSYNLSEKVKELGERLDGEHKWALGWQSKWRTANEELKDLREKLLSATLTPWQHIRLGISLLIKQSK